MYDTVEPLTAGLDWAQRGEMAELVADGRPLARFQCFGGAVATKLVLPGGKAIDVSRQPAAVELEVATVSRRRLAQEDGWTAAVAARLIRWFAAGGITIPDAEGLTTGAVLIRAGFPIVRQASANGLLVPEQVPVWAVESLRATTPRGALEAAVGRRCSRTVVKAFARSLGEGRVGFSVLPLALVIAANDIGDDRLARVFDAIPSLAAAGFVPDRRDIDAVHSCFGRMLAPMAERIAIEAVATDGGVQRLVRVGHGLRGVGDHHGALPGSLEELERLILATVPVAPTQRREGPSRQPPEIAAGPPPREQTPRLPTTPRIAPSVRALREPARFAYDADVERLDGHTFGGFSFVLPIRPDDLRSWGMILRNCLATFVPAVAASRSVIIGVQHRDALVAALEFDPATRQVRQFVGERNRRPSRRLDTRVHGELQALGVMVRP